MNFRLVVKRHGIDVHLGEHFVFVELPNYRALERDGRTFLDSVTVADVLERAGLQRTYHPYGADLGRLAEQLQVLLAMAGHKMTHAIVYET